MSSILFRYADLNDMQMIYAWRNDPAVREACFDSQSISLADHEAWFSKSLKNDQRKILIAQHENEPVGVLRFDLSGDEAEVSIFLSPEKIGRGFGRIILQEGASWAADNLTGVKRILAKIQPDNTASCKAFEKAGFNCLYKAYQLELGS